ncbi:hypothetical protein K413DRAFT_4845 [Clostridium sp. ASBs410]|nr:hypothetical protein K413DRAFT_4845 [Clostridium sp. ASBs410]
MKYEQFNEEVTPSVNEIIYECLQMTNEGYQEYKVNIMKGVVETNAPYILKFFQVVFEIIDEHRDTREVENQDDDVAQEVNLYEVMDKHGCDQDVAELLLQDQEGR